MFAAGETVVRVRPGESTSVDGYGNPVPGVDVETPLPGWAVADGATSEFNQPGRTAVLADLVLYGPPGADVLPADRLRVRGKEYSVNGEPFEWRSPFTGWTPGVVVLLSKVTG